MDQPNKAAIAKMLDWLTIPRQWNTPEGKIEFLNEFVAESSEFGEKAVVQAANRFRVGDVGDGKFAPNIKAFRDECRSRKEIIALQSKPKREPRLVNTGPCPYEVNQERLKHENRNRPVLFEGVSHDRFLKLAKAKQIPVGAHWVAALGTVFGPEQELS